jgi:hypothetical protein
MRGIYSGCYQHYKGPRYRVLFVCPFILTPDLPSLEDDEVQIITRFNRIYAVEKRLWHYFDDIEHRTESKTSQWILTAKQSTNGGISRETRDVVVYVSLSDEGRVSVRDVEEFCGTVDGGGDPEIGYEKISRFKFINQSPVSPPAVTP